MKVSVMRERLHEAIDLATDEKIIQQFNMVTLEISRSAHLTLEEIRELIRDAEVSAEMHPSDDLLEAMIERVRVALETMQKIRGTRSGADCAA